MIIRNIEKYREGDKYFLSAEVVWAGEAPNRMYFAVPEKFKRFLASDASPFLAAILLPCMKRKEDIVIEGSVSTRFMENTRRIMKTFTAWSAEFNMVAISARSVVMDEGVSRATGCFFSGGVDSFYTFLKNKQSITHMIAVHGFDIYLPNKALFGQLIKNIEKAAKRERVEALPVETNIRDFTDPYIDWDWEVGAGLGSVALALRSGFKEVFVASTYSWAQMQPYGTHPVTDPLWTSENLKVVHDGNEARRIDKVLAQVAHSKTALKYLKVCYQNPAGQYNCSRCEKCLRTMIALEVAGVLSKASSFNGVLTPERVQAARAHGLGCKIHMEDNLQALKKKNIRPDIQRALEASIARTNNPGVWTRILKYIGHIDGRYNHSRLYKFLYTLNSGSRNLLLSKTFARLGILQ